MDVFTHFKAHLLLSVHGTLISVNLTDVTTCVNSRWCIIETFSSESHDCLYVYFI